MSKERDVVSTTPGKFARISDLSPEQRRARIVQVLDRGVVGVRLEVDLPPDVYGEWVANDPESIFRMQTLGFEIDNLYAKNRALHNDGTDHAIVGDVIYMTCPKAIKDEIELVREERYNRDNRKKTGLPEESVAQSIQNTGMPTTNTSTQEIVKTKDIHTAVSQ